MPKRTDIKKVLVIGDTRLDVKDLKKKEQNIYLRKFLLETDYYFVLKLNNYIVFAPF